MVRLIDNDQPHLGEAVRHYPHDEVGLLGREDKNVGGVGVEILDWVYGQVRAKSEDLFVRPLEGIRKLMGDLSRKGSLGET